MNVLQAGKCQGSLFRFLSRWYCDVFLAIFAILLKIFIKYFMPLVFGPYKAT